MNAIFDAYNLHVDRMVEFYQRLNRVITYPDGMTTSLGIIYWGRAAHLEEIERAIPKLIESGRPRFSDVLQAARTPASSKKLSEQTGISKDILRILKHDLDLWLPKSVPLAQIEGLPNKQDHSQAFSENGLDTQLTLISAGQTPAQREKLALHIHLDIQTTQEIVKLCDYYRTGKNLTHIRAKIYYAMGMDTWQKWADQNSAAIIAMFTAYIQETHLEEKRLIPWPKEVRNGIEWARMHLEIYAVQW
jgi:hypothetical protein